jgi:hypothetical protein
MEIIMKIIKNKNNLIQLREIIKRDRREPISIKLEIMCKINIISIRNKIILLITIINNFHFDQLFLFPNKDQMQVESMIIMEL